MTNSLTDRQRDALSILRDKGVDRDRQVTQGVWNSLRKRGLVTYRRPHHYLTEEGQLVSETLEAPKTTCTVCGDPISTKSMKRHMQRKHADTVADTVVSDGTSSAGEVDTVTGVFLANGETYTGRVIELTAQDFKRGLWDYFLIETADGDKVIVQTQRAA